MSPKNTLWSWKTNISIDDCTYLLSYIQISLNIHSHSCLGLLFLWFDWTLLCLTFSRLLFFDIFLLYRALGFLQQQMPDSQENQCQNNQNKAFSLIEWHDWDSLRIEELRRGHSDGFFYFVFLCLFIKQLEERLRRFFILYCLYNFLNLVANLKVWVWQLVILIL